MADTAGSLRSLTIEGIPFRATADANLTEIFTNYENSMIATTGRAMRKMVKRVLSVEGITLATNGAERSYLKAFAETTKDLKIDYVNAAGDTIYIVGAIEVENNETEENKTNVKFFPVEEPKITLAP